jgi:hypothetical protein
MLAVTHSELLLRDHCTSRHFKFLALCFEFFLNLSGKIEKILYYTRFISHFVALVCFIALIVALLVL